MKIEIHRLKKTPKPKVLTLEEFADENQLTMVVIERSTLTHGLDNYYAAFKDIEVKCGSGLWESLYGDGKTVRQAIVNYVNQIKGRTLVFSRSIFEDTRQEILVPMNLKIGNIKCD